MTAASPRRSSKPVLAFTSGDPAGIGPRAVVLALRSAPLRKACEPLLVGEASVWRRAGWKPGSAPILDTGLGLKPPTFGRATRRTGAASFAAVRLATSLAMKGKVSGIVTAPISKKAWSLAGVRYSDHTEFFRAELDAGQAEMILGAPKKKLWCVLVTRHAPLMKVGAALGVSRILAAAESLHGALRRLGLRRPRMGLCGLNPHAGEEGLLGSEERRVLAPAAAAARRKGFHLEGPIAADTAWRWHIKGRLDGLVTLYHDQALIPLKAAAGLGVVNWTVGLPFVRTSPGHGTGFDIAGKGAVDCAATLAAAQLAADICRPR